MVTVIMIERDAPREFKKRPPAHVSKRTANRFNCALRHDYNLDLFS